MYPLYYHLEGTGKHKAEATQINNFPSSLNVTSCLGASTLFPVLLITSINCCCPDDEVYTRLKEEAVSAQGQVDFLNSVIVELQNKNSELTARLSAMEDSGIQANGDFSEPVE